MSVLLVISTIFVQLATLKLTIIEHGTPFPQSDHENFSTLNNIKNTKETAIQMPNLQ